MIEVGMVATTRDGSRYTITTVERGRYGLYVDAIDSLGRKDCGFIPFELVLDEELILNWFGWPRKSYITLSNRMRIAGVGFDDFEPHTLEEYEEKWERTEEAMRKEEGNGIGITN